MKRDETRKSDKKFKKTVQRVLVALSFKTNKNRIDNSLNVEQTLNSPVDKQRPCSLIINEDSNQEEQVSLFLPILSI